MNAPRGPNRIDEHALRKRFEATTLYGKSQKERAAAFRGYLTLAREGFPAFIEDAIRISRLRSRDPANLYRLQAWMLQTVLPLETREAIAKQALKEATGEEELDRWRRELSATRCLIRAVRSVGDGIVWRLLNHDRAAYYVLGQGHQQGKIGVSGLEQELLSLGGQLGEEGGTPIMCALTNVLRMGDLLVFRDEVQGAAHVTLVEVKTKKGKSPRVRRQRERLRETVTILDGKHGTVHQTPTTIEGSDFVHEYFLGSTLNVIQESAKAGSAMRCLGDHLCVECHTIASYDADRLARVSAEAQTVVQKWDSAGDSFVELSPWKALTCEANRAPFSVFPFPESVVAGILTNQILLNCWLNVSSVLRKFERSGWQVENDLESGVSEALRSGKDPRESPFATLRRGGLHLALPASTGVRLAFEFLKPKSLIKEANGIFAKGPPIEPRRPGSGELRFYFSEAKTWW
ncbi:hypothetical protein ABI59_05945 [Acidobacteria bacterium Mor1]|nr:hypothetical protein ABI59_05945 [Acidobacteria bacterium Mor1]